MKYCNQIGHSKGFITLVIFVSAPECWDIETALYDRPSVHPYVRL